LSFSGKNSTAYGKIAAKHTGNAMDYKEIADYNNISNPATIKVGQEILIPKSLLK